MAKKKVHPLSLALQGGGAHGAFTWGVLDRMIEAPNIDIRAITATSAGAMNAAAFAAGYTKGGIDGAKESMEAFWQLVSKKGAPFAAFASLNGLMSKLPISPMQVAMAMGSLSSPYDLNPFNINPLKDALDEAIDFEAVRAAPFDLYLCATDVETGRAKVFSDGEITRDAVLASACLPQTFKAVEIDGSAYWDGGYLGNPSLYPLIYNKAPADVLLVLLNPIAREGVPKKAPEITERLNEISFNAALIGELRAIGFVQKLIDDGLLKETIRKKYRRLNIHVLRGGEKLFHLPLETKYDTKWSFLQELRDKGRAAAEVWLAECSGNLGTGKSNVNLREEFLDG